MIKRIRQFIRATIATVSSTDNAFLAEYLNYAEQRLFYNMSLPDQAHALNVAHTAENILRHEAMGQKINETLLIRAALLHDIGRTNSDMNTWGKVAAVLLHNFFPVLAKKLSASYRPSTGWWLQRVMYVYFHHPDIGAKKLNNLGLVKEAALVAGHHATPKTSDEPELTILRQADELN